LRLSSAVHLPYPQQILQVLTLYYSASYQIFFCKIFSLFPVGKFSTPILCSLLANALAQVSQATLITRMRSVLKINVTSKLSKISMPVLYLRASNDRTVPQSASKLIAHLLPQAQITELNAPHFFYRLIQKKQLILLPHLYIRWHKLLTRHSIRRAQAVVGYNAASTN